MNRAFNRIARLALLVAALGSLAGCISPNGPHNCWGSCYSERAANNGQR